MIRIQETPQYFHNSHLGILSKIRQYVVYTFFLTYSVAEFKCPNIIHIIACQYGEELSNKQINAMD